MTEHNAANNRVVEAAREYRRRIKTLAPSIQISVAKPEQLEPIKEAARALDNALSEVNK
jgi:hypothetical protein